MTSPILEYIKKYRPWSSTKEIPRTVLAFLWFVFTATIAGATNAYLDRVNPFIQPDYNGTRWRVHDPLLEALSPIYKKWNIPLDFPDILVRITPIFLVVRLLIAGPHACCLFRRLLCLTGVAYIIRSIFVSITMLPNPNENCISHVQSNFFWHTLELIIQIKASCGDVVFSGHTIIFMTVALMWTCNPHPSFRAFHQICTTIAIIFTTIGTISLVASKYHYTIDCLLSVITMVSLWKLYYYIIRLPTNSSQLSKVIHYIDGNYDYDEHHSGTFPILQDNCYDLPTIERNNTTTTTK